MSDNRAERLRGLSRLTSASFLDDAADEIDRLTAENARLREALTEMYNSACTNATSTPSKAAFLKARAAIARASPPKNLREAILSNLKQRIAYRLNDYLVEMKEGYDDSITGFNEAWDIVRALLDEELARAALPKETT